MFVAQVQGNIRLRTRVPLLLALLVILVLGKPMQSCSAALPPGWTDADIGSPALAGSTLESNGTWTISAGGTDICSSDQLHFAWRPASGDGRIVARVEGVSNTTSGQAGVMFRNDTATGSIEAAVLATANSGVTFQWRSTAGSGCSYQIAFGVPTPTAPVWVSLLRTGNSFSGFWSTNSVDWYQVGTVQTVAMNQTALAGLAASANDGTSRCTATFTDVSLPQPIFGVYRELWPGLDSAAGNSLAALTNTTLNPNWPDNPDPDFSEILSDFETQTNTGMIYYGQRLRTFVIPPLTGEYVFSIASDDTSALFLSGDETPAGLTPIAGVNLATNPREWTRETNQQSAPISLQSGHRYYLEALMQQGTGNDNLAVRWRLPDGTYEEPLRTPSPAGTLLIPCRGVEAPPGIYLQPTNLTVFDGRDAVFSLLVTNQSPVAYQWRANGTNLAGANAATPTYVISGANPVLHNNLTFSCVVSNDVSVVTSAPAVLTVIADTVSPVVVRSRVREFD